MPKVTYVSHAGTEQIIDVAIGQSVMEGAQKNGVTGIIAECGGACSCATCHVYVDEAWARKLEPASEIELSMVEYAVNPKPNSRLSCQIKVDTTLNGLVVHIPESQY